MMADRLKIAMLSVHSCPVGSLGARDTGGMSVYVRELAVELGNLGHRVDVFTRVHDPRDPQIISLGDNARLIHLRAGEDRDIHKLAVYPHLPDFIRNLEDFNRRQSVNYDLVFSHYWLSAWVGERLQRRWHVPHVVIFHTLGAVKNAIGVGAVEPELRIEDEMRLARSAHRVIASTEKEKSDLLKHYGVHPERVSVIPCGVNLELFQPADGGMVRRQLGVNGSKVILYVGRLEPLKGIDRLLQAVAYLQKGYRTRVGIIGGDDDRRDELEKLQELSRELNIANSVDFLGRIEQRRLPHFYSAANVCVVPSYYETFGLVALESLACGTPVVAADVGGIRDVISQGETGYVVMDNDPHRLAAKIDMVLSGSGLKSVLSIRDSVSQLSWANVARRIEDEVLSGCFACSVGGGAS